MNLRDSIQHTIAFFDLFDFPLTAQEVYKYLYQYNKPLHLSEIRGTLAEMPEVEKIHDYYVIKGRTHLIDTRKARKFIAEKWWGRVRQYCQYLVKIPFVEMIAVCNNLAYDNASESSDIDLFIAIKAKRLWMTRLIITLVLQFFGVRRHGNKIKGRFCLSFFVTTKRLNMEPLIHHNEDPYLAYWTKLLVPIYGKKTYEQFKTENEKWLEKKYHLTFDEVGYKAFPFPEKSSTKTFFEWLFSGYLGHFSEKIVRYFFRKRTLKKKAKLGPKANVMVQDDILKFHNIDRRQEYFDEWIERVKNMRKIALEYAKAQEEKQES